MAVFIMPPAPVTATFNGDITQKLDATVSSTSTLVANTASTILAVDATATLGKKIYSIVNTFYYCHCQGSVRTYSYRY